MSGKYIKPHNNPRVGRLLFDFFRRPFLGHFVIKCRENIKIDNSTKIMIRARENGIHSLL